MARDVFGDISGGTEAWVTRVEDYGAQGDNTTDDTSAIKNAVKAACDQAVSNGSYYAVVQFDPTKRYKLSGSLTQGGTTKGNALIPIPVFPDTGKKMILVLKGSQEQAITWHWNQTVRQDAGATLWATTVGTADNTFGVASVIGGPTPEQGYGSATTTFSNMIVVVDGLSILVPNDPHICGFDFSGIAQMRFINGACTTDATPATKTDATQGWTFGLRTPQNNNNANSSIGFFSGLGINFAVVLNEHTQAFKITAIYCVAALEVGEGGTGHGIRIQHLCAEACQVGIGAYEGTNHAVYPTKLVVEQMDFENITFAVVNDPNNRLLGSARISGIGDGNLLVDAPSGGISYAIRGAQSFQVYDAARQAGVQASSPGIPSTTVALRNPFFRDAMVHVASGTVTNIQITDSGGSAQTVGVTAGAILVPTGAYITLTYSIAPSWKWTLL